MADPDQDPRGAADVDPLWSILDLTPAGRGATWYGFDRNSPEQPASSWLVKLRLRRCVH